MPKSLTRDTVLANIREIADKLKCSSLSFQQYICHGGHAYATLVRLFGSIDAAFATAGLQKHSPQLRTTNEDIINDIQDVAKRNSLDSMSHMQYLDLGGKHHHKLINKRFTSWDNACQLAGLAEHTNNRIIDDDLVKADIIRVYQKLQRPFSQEEYIEYGLYNKNTLAYKFGSFRKALDLVKVPPKVTKKQYSPEQLIAYIRKYHKEFGSVPTVQSLSVAAGYPSEKPYWETYPGKTWAEILRLAGLESEHKTLAKDGLYYDSVMEAEIANSLYSNLILYESHKKVCEHRQWRCDFYLPQKDLWIEFDGLGNQRKPIERYHEKLQYYKDQGYHFLELSSGDDLLDKLDLYLPIRSPTVRTISFTSANDFLFKTHYLGNATHGSQHYGAYHDNILVGVICLGNTANPSEKALAITRIAWLDRVRNDKNFGSKFVSQVLRLVKRGGYDGPIVSWSDPRYHLGTLYAACNFKKAGKSYKDYVYIDVNGIEYHKSKCRVPAGRSEAEYARSLGLVRVDTPSKQKWIYE